MDKIKNIFNFFEKVGYSYIDALKDRSNVSIILSYPEDAFQKDKALKAFISLDTTIEEIFEILKIAC